MDPVQPGRSLLRRIFTSRLIRYPFYLFLILILTFALIGMFVSDDDTFDTAQSLHSGTNPYRDLPADQDVALREVLFITGTLRDTFLPTSLPEEDDYEFLSRLLRSLETRDDISWTTLHETGAERTIMAIANRRRYFAAEPFGLTARLRSCTSTGTVSSARRASPRGGRPSMTPPSYRRCSRRGGWMVKVRLIAAPGAGWRSYY